MINHTTLQTLKKCALCHKEQSLKEFIALSGTHNLLDMCRTCQANESSEGDGGGGLQLNSINQQYTILIDEKLKLEEKEETKTELEEKFFQDKDLKQEQRAQEHTAEQNKLREIAEESPPAPPADSVANNPTLARQVALQNTNAIFRTQQKITQTTLQTKQQQAQTANSNKSWFMQKNNADQHQQTDAKTLSTKQTTQHSNSTLFKANQEHSATEKAATERADTFLNKTFGPGKKH